jgi:hypothetical protein
MDAPVRRREIPFIGERISIGGSEMASCGGDDFEGGIPELRNQTEQADWTRIDSTRGSIACVEARKLLR